MERERRGGGNDYIYGKITRSAVVRRSLSSVTNYVRAVLAFRLETCYFIAVDGNAEQYFSRYILALKRAERRFSRCLLIEYIDNPAFRVAIVTATLLCNVSI